MRQGLIISLAFAAAAFAWAAPASAGGTADWLEAFAPNSEGRWMVRARGLAVIPQDGDDLSVNGVDTSIDTAIVPEIDVTYFITPNIAAELILAVTPHEVSAKTPSGNVDLGEVLLLPPTLTLQYHFTDLGDFKPYVGAGVNYTMFFSGEEGDYGITYQDSIGWALQAGLDYQISDGVYFNVDVKKLWLNTDVNVEGDVITGNVDVNPWLIGVGVGYRF